MPTDKSERRIEKVAATLDSVPDAQAQRAAEELRSIANASRSSKARRQDEDARDLLKE